MANKVKICKYCRSEIDKKAKVCPHCRKKQSAGCGTVLLFSIIVAVGLSITVVKMAESDMPKSTSNVQSEISQLSESDYKAACKAVTYEEIARPKDGLKGEKVTFTGEIVQATSGRYRMNVTKGQFSYTDTIMFDVDEDILSEKILEDDIVTIWGESEGQYTYKAVLGNEITLPKIKVFYVENHGKEK